MADRRIYKNLFLLAVIIFSYIALLFFISNEGFKRTSPYTYSMNKDMFKQSVPFQKANFEEIQINKNLLDVK